MKNFLLSTIVVLINLFFSYKSSGNCNIKDWSALKILYENMEGTNWKNNSGWEQVKSDYPLANCNLEDLYGVYLNDLGRVKSLDLNDNNLQGKIPIELGDLNDLNTLLLSNNQLIGNIPNELGNLNKLKNLRLQNNRLDGNIPIELGDLSNLEYLWLFNNELKGSIPIQLSNLFKLKYLSLSNNYLSGKIPVELNDLNKLANLDLGNNQLTGNIPTELSNLHNLVSLRLVNNKLNGVVPPFNANLSRIDISQNLFICSDFVEHFYHNQQIANYKYKPQYFIPLNYAEIQSTILDSMDVNEYVSINLELPLEFSVDYEYQWVHQINSATQRPQIISETPHILKIDNFQLENVGRYSLAITYVNCLPNGDSFDMLSEPIYIIFKGFDLYGQPIEYTQLMVEFENQAEKDLHEQEIFLDNGGIWIDKCDCNRELHLYDFPNDSSSIEQAYIALDKKIKRGKARNKMDGGFNYKLNNIGLNALTVQMSTSQNQLQKPSSQNEDSIAYAVEYNYLFDNYNDAVNIYLLDSGLDELNFDTAADFLHTRAPIDSCFNFSAPGYNYAMEIPPLKEYSETIDTDYIDREGHGTFGFRSISSGLQEATNAKIVPLKIIEEATDGNLFDLICATYHAIDHNADVINISAGYRGEASGILEDAIYQAKQKGIFIVVAAGNDSLDIDQVTIPQYPAYYASQYHKFYIENGVGEPILDSVLYDNLITVASVNCKGELSAHSNYGAASVCIAAPGENIYGYGLEGTDAVGSGTSIATFLATQVLAREIARDSNRKLHQIRADFEDRYLVSNPNLAIVTKTGKQLDFHWTETEIKGCTDCTACNYFPYATIEDGSCYYCAEEPDEIIELACDSNEYCPPCSPLEGCMDVNACNYSPSVTINIGLCVYENCSTESELVICPKENQVNICAPINPQVSLGLSDFMNNSDVTFSNAWSLQVIQTTDAFKYYRTTTYDYIISKGVDNQTTCQTKYYIANQFLQAPQVTSKHIIFQDCSWDYIKLGFDEYKIYRDNNGMPGKELTTCTTSGLQCSTSNLKINTAETGSYQFWVTQFFTFPNGAICESEASPFQVEIQPKPPTTLSKQNIKINKGEVIALMDVTTNKIGGYWSGKNILYTITSKGENIPYFSANSIGLYKLYYTVQNGYCQQNNLLIVNVVEPTFSIKDAFGLTKNDYRIHSTDLANSIIIFPNPSNGKIYVELNEDNDSLNKLTVFDLASKAIYIHSFTGSLTEFNLSNLAKGIYIISIENVHKKHTQKLLIK